MQTTEIALTSVALVSLVFGAYQFAFPQRAAVTASPSAAVLFYVALVGAFHFCWATIAVYAARVGSDKEKRRILQVSLLLNAMIMWTSIHRSPVSGPLVEGIVMSAAELALLFAALYVFKTNVSEVFQDPLKSSLYAIGAGLFFLGIYITSFPVEWSTIIEPTLVSPKLDAFAVNINGVVGVYALTVGLALIYASASGISHERRRAAQAAVFGLTVLVFNNALRPTGTTNLNLAIAAGSVASLLLFVLYVLRSTPVTGPIHSTRGSNSLLRLVLLSAGVLNVVNAAASLVQWPLYLDLFYPEANGVFSKLGLVRAGNAASFYVIVGVMAIYASRQGGAHEQRRVAQAISFGDIALIWNDVMYPINSQYGKIRISLVVLQFILLNIGLYGVKGDKEAAESKEKVDEEEEEEQDQEESVEPPKTPRKSASASPVKPITASPAKSPRGRLRAGSLLQRK